MTPFVDVMNIYAAKESRKCNHCKLQSSKMGWSVILVFPIHFLVLLHSLSFSKHVIMLDKWVYKKNTNNIGKKK